VPEANPVPDYRERLFVPLRWWVQGTMLVASLWLALVVAVPFVLAWVFGGVALALMAGLLLAFGAPTITVVGGELKAGRARIGAEHLGEVTPLDPEAARRLAGREADARAHLLLRPYLKRAVRVEITDPADPAPYWLLATRRPDRLAQALKSAPRGGGVPD
jgi:hypothetical protein